MKLPDGFDPTNTEGLTLYEDVSWEIPEGAVSNLDVARQVFLEWQHGVIWLELMDVPGTDTATIRVTQLRGREILKQGVRALDAERTLMFTLGANAGGIELREMVGNLPAADSVSLHIARQVADDVEEGEAPHGQEEQN